MDKIEETKKDHSIGAGTGALAGGTAGAAIGSIAGPVGAIAGAVGGAVLGAKAGDEIAEAVNPTEYIRTFETSYEKRPYYTERYEWSDYKPAYQYGYDTYSQYQGRRFEDVESELRQGWEEAKLDSQLAWAEAKDAVRDGWHHIERKMPGDFDRDGR